MYFKPWVVAAFVARVRASESDVEEEASLQSSTLSGGDYFGGAVSAASGTVLVSAYLDGTGSVYTFEKNNFDAWAETNHWTNPMGSTYEGFGSSVSISKSPFFGNDDVAAVGSSQELGTGAVFIYRRTAKGSEQYTYYQWDFVQRLVVDDLKAGDNFGASVALDGDTLLVGCTFGDGQDIADSGRAFVFNVNKATGEFEMHQELPRSTIIFAENENDYFGNSVALSGDIAVVGAHNSDVLGTNSGAVFVYVRDSEGTWTFQAELVSGDTVDYDYFGFSVAVSGEYALVGAFGVDTPNPSDVPSADGVAQSGAAYLFKRSGSKWNLKQTLVKDDPDASDQFGASVSLGSGGATALVSAMHESATGCCYVFVASGDKLMLETEILASDGRAGDFFGFSTALDDTTGIAVIGAPLKGETEDAANSGGAYVYHVPLGAYAESRKFSAGGVVAIVFSVLFVVFSAIFIYTLYEKKQRGEDPFAQCKTMLAQMTKEQSDGNASAKYQNMGPETNPKAELL